MLHKTTQATEKAQPEMQVYYDGSCPLCTLEISHYRKQDGAEMVDFIDVSQEGQDPAPDLDRQSAMARFHVRTQDGTLVSGARGFVALWDRLPGWRRLGKLAGTPGVIHVLELVYRAFLPLRPTLSKAAARLGFTPENSGHGQK